MLTASRFRRGWAKPLFSYEEVEHLLELAADIVVKIRKEVDEKNSSLKLRVLDGSAREFLWVLNWIAVVA